MHPVAFLGGVTTGAAGLAAAALWNKKRSEETLPSELECAFALDKAGLCRLLNKFYFRAQELYVRCNILSMKGSELMEPPLELPDDDFLQTIRNAIAGKGNFLLRGWYEKNAADLKKDARTLFARYRNVFIAANETLTKGGRETVDLSTVHFSGKVLPLDNSLQNEDWSDQFSEKIDEITGFLEIACEKANQLINGLEAD